MSVEVKGLKELIFDLRAFPENVQQRVIFNLSQVAYDSAQKGAGRHTQTGALFQSLFNRPSSTTIRTVGHDVGRAPHARFVIQGTRPHVILPNKRKALRWPDGGKFIFAKSVNHPGYAGDPYMDNAADDALRKFETILNEAIAGAI